MSEVELIRSIRDKYWYPEQWKATNMYTSAPGTIPVRGRWHTGQGAGVPGWRFSRMGNECSGTIEATR